MLCHSTLYQMLKSSCLWRAENGSNPNFHYCFQRRQLLQNQSSHTLNHSVTMSHFCSFKVNSSLMQGSFQILSRLFQRSFKVPSKLKAQSSVKVFSKINNSWHTYLFESEVQLVRIIYFLNLQAALLSNLCIQLKLVQELISYIVFSRVFETRGFSQCHAKNPCYYPIGSIKNDQFLQKLKVFKTPRFGKLQVY